MWEFLARSLEASTIFTFAGLGELVGQRSGILNVGIEGVMLFGATLGFMAAQATESYAIGFLVAIVGDAANSGRTFGKKCDDGEGLHGIADPVHVDIDAAQLSSRDGDAVRCLLDLTPHLPKHLAETHIPLHRAAGQPIDLNGSARDGSYRPEIAGC